MSRISDLRRLLEAYRPAGDEADSATAVLELIAGEANALSANHFAPGHVTASAFVVDTTSTRLLLIHHGKLDLWLQPGGHVDDEDEDVLSAAVREVEEETGVTGVPILDGIFDVDVHPIPASEERPAHHHYDVRFLLRAANDGLRDSEEVLGVRWAPFGGVPDLVTDLSVLRATEKIKAIFPE